MPAPSQARAATDLEIDRSTHSIRLIRVFDATRAQIFAAWTRPEHVTCWWDAAGDPLTTCEIDLRVNGAFKFVTKSHPEMPFAGSYRELAPPDHLTFEALGSTGRVVLREIAGKTQMTVEIRCGSAEQLEQFLKLGVAAGTSQTLDNLVDYARRRAGTGW
ncbi:MAG TPA: SRPBCC domain-containing protein [Steroidobacteraceae bacterium]|nr:SRPBCC domain-containing protein [Steroidobacteraceae bacterium]